MFQSLRVNARSPCAIRDATLVIPVAGTERAKSPASLQFSFSCHCIDQGRRANFRSKRAVIELPHNFDAAVEMLDQRRTGLDPIAAVVVGDVTEFTDGSAVDVSAKNAVHPIAFRISNDRSLELPDETNSIFDPLLDVSAKRPVTKAEATTEEID